MYYILRWIRVQAQALGIDCGRSSDPAEAMPREPDNEMLGETIGWLVGGMLDPEEPNANFGAEETESEGLQPPLSFASFEDESS